jgi:hypothetical protein
VELQLVGPELAQLDELDLEVVACCVWIDARPSRGVAGQCDFRLAGRISELQRRSLITGALGETVLVPGKPRLPFDKVLLFGAGTRATFDEGTFIRIVSDMLAAMERLSVRAAAVELPGRHDDLIAPERAASLLLDQAGGGPAHDVWTLVEGPEGKQRITRQILEQRRRARRIP